MASRDDLVSTLMDGTIISAQNQAGSKVWTRLRSRYFADYNRTALIYWLCVVSLGAATLVLALAQVAMLDAQAIFHVTVGVAVASLVAAFPVRIPRSKHSMSPGDIFMFLLLLTHGPAAAAVAAAGEGLVGAMRTTQSLTSRIATPTMAALSMYMCGMLFEGALHTVDYVERRTAGVELALLAGAALTYFFINTLLVTVVVHLKRGEPLRLTTWFATYSWVAAVHLFSAAVAAALYLNLQSFGSSMLIVGALVVVFVLALRHLHFRKQEADNDVQDRKLASAEREAEVNQRRFHSAFTNAAVGMALVSSDGRVLQANRALCALLGHDEMTMRGRAFRDFLHPGDVELLDKRLAQWLATRGGSMSIELRCVRFDQRESWVNLHCGQFGVHDEDADPDSPRLILQLHDITSRRRAEGQLLHVAYHDSLTDLANRSRFQDRLSAAIEQSALESNQRFAVMFLDLDRFKVVNDSLGHAAGDELLKEVAQRLRACVRPKDLVARLGGDEFAVLLEDVGQPQQVVALAERILLALSVPVKINGTELAPAASIGITFSDMGYRTHDEVLRDADLAMYKAKTDGRARVTVFDSALHAQAAQQLQLETELRRAIGEGKLSLAFQPVYQLEPYQLAGFEALVRWIHPQRGPISPGEFIPLAEDTGLIEALTKWVIDEACAQLARWRARDPSFAQLRMNVNVSGKDLSRGRLARQVGAMLERHQLPPELLTIEITETMLMEHLDVALRSLDDLRALGVRLAIDDFGTGYSSLAYLTTLPIQSLKIDRSFVLGMSRDARNLEVVRAVLLLGKALNKQVVAEGIETPEQLLRLQQLGVHYGQGYLLSKPLDAERIENQLLTAAHPAAPALT